MSGANRRWVKACQVSDVPEGTMLPVDVDDLRLMIVNVNGELHAVSRVCTHETADLSTGFLMESRVTCPLHLSQFDVKEGTALSPPATEPLPRFNVKIESDAVLVEI